MNVIFMGKTTAGAQSLEYVLNAGDTVQAVVTKEKEDEPVYSFARDHNLNLCTPKDIVAKIKSEDLEKSDVIFSILHGKRIRQPLLSFPRRGIINFHPAPLPEYRGVGCMNLAILHDRRTWNVTSHFIDESIDTGDILYSYPYAVSDTETECSLMEKTQYALFECFKIIYDRLKECPEKLVGIPQTEGTYYSRAEIDLLRKINFMDSKEMMQRKIRAFNRKGNEPYVEIEGMRYYIYSFEELRAFRDGSY